MHWAELTADICQGDMSEEATRFVEAIHRSAEIAGVYRRDLKFPTFMAEVPGEVLDGAAVAADWYFIEGDDSHEHLPVVVALTFAARALLYETAEQPAILKKQTFPADLKRLCVFVLLEKMRRMEVFESMAVPFDPWDGEAMVKCEGQRPEQMRAFRRFLGYEVA